MTISRNSSRDPHRKSWPVIIVGGGPAGSTLGCYLSEAGIDHLILERAIHPRPHVGESMVTSTTRVFQEIGFLDTMEREGFVRKYGASWHPADRLVEVDIAFAEFPQDGIDQAYTYHVDRSKFDLLLLKHAECRGSRVLQGVAAKRVIFDGHRAVGVELDIGGEPLELRADIVVDASGRDTLLGRQLRLKKKDPIFNQFALHAWFEGVSRGGQRTEDYIHIYFLPVERGWAWQIPITDEITSMGVVTDLKVFRGTKDSPERAFFELAQTNRALARALAGATRVTGLNREGNYSYSLERFSGPGFVIIGDAARFVDPIFSSGVSVAMHSAKFASEAIVHALGNGDLGARAFAPYEARIRAGVEIWYEFIKLYYKLLPGFTRFIQSPEHRLDILRLLQGDVYDRENVQVLEAMRAFIRSVEDSGDHLLRSSLTDIPID